jgi:peptidoglycan/LPS O-acetylase OafA/YrhL
VALVSTAILVATPVADVMATMDGGFDGPHVLAGLVFAVEGWAWTIAVLGFAMRTARLQRPVASRLGDAVLPVYVVHQPVILAVAFFVVQWPIGLLPKWVVVFGVSLAITAALVELGLRGRITRALLGARTASALPRDDASHGIAVRPRPTVEARHG